MIKEEPKPSDYLTDVIKCAKDAGVLIMRYYKTKSLEVRLKQDQTPVTGADEAAHEYIKKTLASFSDFRVVSEEDTDPPSIEAHETYWLVDPLDGTKEFIAETGEFTVNIALIYKNAPILGVIDLPAYKQTYFATQKGGAFKQDHEGKAKSISCRPFQSDDFVLVISRRHESGELDSFQAKWPGARIHLFGSSIKFCKIAEGAADLYVRRGKTHIWDTGAGECILSAAGGKLVSTESAHIPYDPGQTLNHSFWAIGDKKCSETFL